MRNGGEKGERVRAVHIVWKWRTGDGQELKCWKELASQNPGNIEKLLSQYHTTGKWFPNVITKMVSNKAQPVY